MYLILKVNQIAKIRIAHYRVIYLIISQNCNYTKKISYISSASKTEFT